VSAETDMRHRIAASALIGWIERRKSFFNVRAYSRRSSVLYESATRGPAISPVGPKLAFGLRPASIYFWPQFRVNTLLLKSRFR
jgi:hypothetical protein